MKALSYRDPWGWLVAMGIKPVDNRSWKTNFRGRIYIHVSKTFDEEGFVYIRMNPDLIRQIPNREDFYNLKINQPNAGKIIGEVDVVDCVDKSESPWFFGPFGLIHKNPALYKVPVACKGHVFPHFWQPDPEVEALIKLYKEGRL